MRVTRRSLLDGRTARYGTGSFFPASGLALRAALVLLIFALGLLVGIQGWQRPVALFLDRFRQEPRAAFAALIRRRVLPTLTLDLAFADFQTLVDRRNLALVTGAHLPTAATNVPATLHFEGKSQSVGLDLLSGPAPLFEGERWPFVLTSWVGETQRALLRPTEGTAATTEAYLDSLSRAGLPTTDYRPVQLLINGSSWGEYALETPPVPAAPLSGTTGVEPLFVYFDPVPLLKARQPSGESAPENSFAYARVVAAPALGLSAEERDRALREDPRLAASAQAAERRLEALLTGEGTPSELLEVESTGRFLALTAFWHRSLNLDWPSLAFRYDPAAELLVPVGNSTISEGIAAAPSQLFDDPQIRRLFTAELARLAAADPGSFGKPDASEELLPSVELVAEHQAWVHRLLTPDYPLVGAVIVEEEALLLRLRNTQPFPLRLEALDLGEAARIDLDPAWIVSQDTAAFVTSLDARVVLRSAAPMRPRYARLRIPLSQLPAMPAELRVVTALWGWEEGPEMFVALEEVRW